MTYTAFVHSSQANNIMGSIHRTGCRDIARTIREHSAEAIGEFQTAAEGIEDIIGEQGRELGYDETWVKVHNCAK